MKELKKKEAKTTHKRTITLKTITKNKTYKITALILSIIFMFNLDAIVDHFFHPEISYFNEEHIIVGCATGLFGIAFLIIVYFFFYYQLKFEDELFRAVLNNAPITIFATDSHGVFTLSEGKGLERVGLKPGDNVGVSALDLYNFLPFVEKTGKVTNGKDVISRALAGESVTAFSLLFGVHFENHIGPLLDKKGNIAGIVGVATDITERKLAEEALRESEEKYRNLVENLGKEYFFYRHNRYGVFTYVSNSMTEMLGYSVQEFLTHHTEYHTNNPINKGAVRHTELSILGQQQSPYEVEVYHKDKSIIWLEVTEIPLFNYNGEVYTIEGIAKNITERKLAEEELRESEEKYRKLVEFSPDALLIHIDGIIQFVNKASVKLFDADSKDNLIGKEVINFVHPDYRKIVRQRIGKIIDEKVEVPMIEEKLVTLKGVVFDAEVTAIPIGLMGRNGVQVIARDITERKRAEETIRKNNQLIQNIIDYSPSLIYVLDTEGRFNLVNIKFEKLFNIKRENIIGKTREPFMPKEIIKFHTSNDLEVINSKQAMYFEEENLEPDGKHSYLSQKFPLFDSSENVYAVGGISTDITERKKAEEELQHVHDQLQEAQRITHGGSWEADFVSGKLVWSDEMYRIYGVDRESFGHTREALLELIHPDDRHILLDSFQRIFSGKQNLISHQFRIIHPDGSIHFVESSNKAYFDSSGKPVRVIGATQDITERKKSEEEIKESKNQLEKLYKRLNDIRENERADISREIHDELGQSLTALKMDLNWTKENLTDKMLAAKKFNGMIDIVSETIKKIQKISAALRPGMLDDLGLIPAVQWYGQEFEERSGLKCNFDLKELPALNSQINLTLFRIFQEGLTNIIRHANAKSIDVKLYPSSGNIILKITDDGIGMEQEKINSKESLGLLGMKERIKQFNGSLEVISSENSGTGLIVSIPIIN
ncbi:MAG: PAS domain S-box protein [Melioribacter sp.]|nr:PAS domain S-box protein [Melioribacter sp.]